MSDFENIRALASLPAPRVLVDRIDLVELLAELDTLRTGGAAKSASKYTAEFEEAWSLYPSRPGNSKAAAFKAWAARLKAGATVVEMIDGTAKYAAYVKAERTEAHFIKQAATFYGPGEHFAADWTPRRAVKPVALTDINAANNAEAKRRLFGGPPDDGMTIDAA